MGVWRLSVVFALLVGLALGAESHDKELARRFLALEKYEKAAEVLERLFAQNPEDEDVQSMLEEAYAGMKAYDKLESFLGALVLRRPQDPMLWAELGAARLAVNKPDEAWRAFEKATKLDPKNSALVVKIHRALLQWGYIDRDIQFLTKARRQLGEKHMFALELARLYEIKGRFDDAVREYANYLKEHPDRFGEVKHRIDIGERTPEELRQLRSSLELLFRTDVPKWQTWQLISLVDQKLGDYDAAFEALRKAEESRASSLRGELMLRFAEDMLRILRYDVAERAARYAAEEGGARYKSRARLYLARALRGLGKFEDALAALDSIIEQSAASEGESYIDRRRFIPSSAYSRTALRNDALLEKAEIQIEELRDLTGAEKTLETILSQRRPPDRAFALKGKLLLYRGDFEGAKEFLADAYGKNPKNDEVAYLLAMSYFFAGSFDSASAALHGVVSRFPKSELGNEAVELLLILQSGEDAAAIVREPMLATFSHDTAKAYRLWESALKDESLSAFGDYVLWKLGLCQVALGDTAAKSTLRELVERYPQSFYAPLALEVLAQAELSAGNAAKASEILVRIVNEYPDAVNIEEVRRKLRSISGNL